VAAILVDTVGGGGGGEVEHELAVTPDGVKDARVAVGEDENRQRELEQEAQRRVRLHTAPVTRSRKTTV